MCDALTVDPIVEKEGGRRDYNKNTYLNFAANLLVWSTRYWLDLSTISLSSSDGAEFNTSDLR